MSDPIHGEVHQVYIGTEFNEIYEIDWLTTEQFDDVGLTFRADLSDTKKTTVIYAYTITKLTGLNKIKMTLEQSKTEDLEPQAYAFDLFMLTDTIPEIIMEGTVKANRTSTQL